MKATNQTNGRRIGLMMLVAVLVTPLAVTTSASAQNFGWGSWNIRVVRPGTRQDNGWNERWNQRTNGRTNDRWNHRSNGRWNDRSNGGHDGHADHNGHHPSVGKPKPFKRGTILAGKDGHRNGYRDGYAGNPRCDTPTRDLCGREPAFIKGYMKTYYSAYCAAYEAGKRARRYERRRNVCW